MKSTETNSLRPKLKVNQVAKIMAENPNKVYCGVRHDEEYDPNNENVDKYIAAGWDIVSDTHSVQDDRSNSPSNSKEESLRAHPLIKNGKGNAQFVFMCIDKDKLAENESKKSKAAMDKYIASSTGRKAVRKGKTLTITDSEVTEDSIPSSDD